LERISSGQQAPLNLIDDQAELDHTAPLNLIGDQEYSARQIDLLPDGCYPLAAETVPPEWGLRSGSDRLLRPARQMPIG
jgi:hypothetical protein